MSQKVEVGQVWEDFDIRYRNAANPRRVKVITVGHMDAVVQNVATKRRTIIALKRFRASSNGYRLVANV